MSIPEFCDFSEVFEQISKNYYFYIAKLGQLSDRAINQVIKWINKSGFFIIIIRSFSIPFHSRSLLIIAPMDKSRFKMFS